MTNPMQMRMRDRLVNTIRQQTPLVLGQKGLRTDMVSSPRVAVAKTNPVLTGW